MMSDNYYQPPEARVDDVATLVAPPFYIVSPRKFILLYLGTVGMYGVYWFYENWALLKRHRNLKIWPVPRAIFSIFFTHSLFDEVDRALKSASLRYYWNAGTLATAFVVLSLVSSLVGHLANRDIGSPATDFASLLLLPAAMFPLLAAQKAANHAVGDPEGNSNNTLTAANIVWLVIGVLLWLLTLLGLYIAVVGEDALQ
jgi:hypothetical protein